MMIIIKMVVIICQNVEYDGSWYGFMCFDALSSIPVLRSLKGYQQ